LPSDGKEIKMNDVANMAKKKFFDTLVGRSVTTRGIAVDHDEELTKAGVQQLWDALKLADLEIKERP
jgi:hypothetical protein